MFRIIGYFLNTSITKTKLSINLHIKYKNHSIPHTSLYHVTRTLGMVVHHLLKLCKCFIQKCQTNVIYKLFKQQILIIVITLNFARLNTLKEVLRVGFNEKYVIHLQNRHQSMEINKVNRVTAIITSYGTFTHMHGEKTKNFSIRYINEISSICPIDLNFESSTLQAH